MQNVIQIAQIAVPFALRIAKFFMQKVAEKGGISPQEAAAIALFDSVVAFIEAQDQKN